MIKSNDKLVKLNGFSTQETFLGNGLRFDGVDDFVNCSDILNYQFNYTFSGFIYVTNVNYDAPQNFQNATILTRNQFGFSARNYGVYVTKPGNGNTVFDLAIQTSNNDALGYVSLLITDAIQLNKLYFFSITNSLGNVYLECIDILANIKKIASGVLPIYTHDNINRLFTVGITRENVDRYVFSGIIYDLKVFNKALNQAEIDILYISKGGIIPISARVDLVANYRFNQKISTTLLDSSSNNYHGTLTNFANTTPSAENAWVDEQRNSILI